MPEVVLSDVARPLNSHEISKVFCSILAGVAAVEPGEVAGFGTLVDLAKALATSTDTDIIKAAREQIHRKAGAPTWRTAFSATVAGFYGWCAPLDVELALTWVSQNIHRLFPSTPPPEPVYS